MTQAFFITGTDTDAGKTVVAAALLHKAQSLGLATLGLKPVAAGGLLKNGEFVNEDAWQLLALSTPKPNYSDVNPVALREAIAPHIAATREQVSISAGALAEHCKAQLADRDFCVIEGAGGWQVPLNETESMVDLAAAIARPVVLVAGIRLGCINHTLLSVAAIKASGLTLAGWVANEIDERMPAIAENVATLQDKIAAPLLGHVPFMQNPQPNKVAEHIDVHKLLVSATDS